MINKFKQMWKGFVSGEPHWNRGASVLYNNRYKATILSAYQRPDSDDWLYDIEFADGRTATDVYESQLD